MRFRGKFIVLYCLLYALSSISMVLCQEPVPKYLLDYNWLEDKEQKAWKKNLNQIGKAEELMRSSNDLYIQAFNTEKDASLSEGKRKSKAKKLEEEANKNSLDALLLYKDSYSEFNQILLNYLDNVDKDHSARKEYENLHAEALKKYSSAESGMSPEEQRLLSEANDLHLLALEKAIISVNTPAASYKQPNVPKKTTTEELEMNTEMYEMYQRYINNEDIPAPIALQNILTMEDDEVSYEAFSAMWLKYHLDQQIELQATNIDESIEKDTVLVDQVVSETESYGMAEVEKDPEGQKLLSEVVEQERLAATNDSKSGPSKEIGDHTEFRVQLAASKSPLSIVQIQAIYKGERSILEFREGSYYKYQIRGFKFANEAQDICSSSGVSNAYIQAYHQNESVNLAGAMRENLKLQKNLGTHELISDIEFSVQLAASRIKLSPKSINKLNTGNHLVSLILEDGWYKYQILVGTDVSEAYEILETTATNNAFIVAYRNGEKLKLYNALKQYKLLNP